MKSSATILSISDVSCFKSEASQRDSNSLIRLVTSSVTGEVSILGEGSGVGDGGTGVGEGFGVGLGLGDGVGVGFGVGLGLGDGVGDGVGVGFGVGLGLGDGVGEGDGEGLTVAVAVAVAAVIGAVVADATGFGVVGVGLGRAGVMLAVTGGVRIRDGDVLSGFTVGNVIGPLVEAALDEGRAIALGLGTVTGFEVGLGKVFGVVLGVGSVIGFDVEAGEEPNSGVGIGDASMIGVGLAGGVRDKLSLSEEVGVSIGSGVALASGLTVAVGDDFTVGIGDAFGLALGLGDSGAAAGVLDWKGVDAASCALTRAAEASKTVARTNRRMITYLPEISSRR